MREQPAALILPTPGRAADVQFSGSGEASGAGKSGILVPAGAAPAMPMPRTGDEGWTADASTELPATSGVFILHLAKNLIVPPGMPVVFQTAQGHANDVAVVQHMGRVALRHLQP